MELSIANRGNNDLLVPKVRKEKKEVKSTYKVSKGAIKEAMVISTAPLKFIAKKRNLRNVKKKTKKDVRR